MRRSVITILMTLGILAGGVASAAPGPNGHNDFGLCKAYFAGSETGQANKRSKGPFPALEAAADDGDANTSVEDDVRAFCAGTTPGGKGNTTPTPGGQTSTGSANGGAKGGSKK